MSVELKQEAIKASPPVAVTAYATMSGLSLNEWVAIATLLYIALQVVVLVRKEFLKRPKATRTPQDE